MTAPLPNAENRPIKKGSAGSRCYTGSSADTARSRPPTCTTATSCLSFRPRISRFLIRGQLLIGVNRQQENLYQHEKRDQKQTRHGGTLRIHVCRVGRKVGRAAVHERKYSPFPRVGQGLTDMGAYDLLRWQLDGLVALAAIMARGFGWRGF